MKEQLIPWLLTATSLVGAVYNAKGNIWGFFIWIPANIGWVIYDVVNGQWAQALLFTAYTGITAYGIYMWRKKKIK